MRRGVLAGRRRIIPALAGNTDVAAESAQACMDHPRSRGEYDHLHQGRWQWDGSSPLSRGIPELTVTITFTLRIIPALAGNTARSPTRRGDGPDHPRSRGEYARQRLRWLRQWGSSPLSRGIRGEGVGGLRLVGIIPALAGNTRRGGWWPPACRDHPRSRGEYSLGVGDHAAGGGSSPLSRGIPAQVLEAEDLLGIIPALAGNTAPRPG